MSNSTASLVSDKNNVTIVFIDELKVLEEHYNGKNQGKLGIKKLSDSFINQYDELLKRVKKYAKHSNKENVQKEAVILNYISSSIISRMNVLSSRDSGELVIDILGFLNIIKNDIENLNQEK
ncbi:MAG: hypothetical protein F6K25_16565 [Okeania sp. SIO2G4]|uniref:hypothetical protein n=1 Tax=unclassified Okeania TaxID=2634635 RepID=UPI0013BCD9C8|nr:MULTISPECIES: hypothetical protein [unclassified Okeania]NEP45485.1 hypothetical protein [Okeania sp. SIO2H7]NEP73662.1 hypothetical protein [Okeania sp. SIO2G5]NEP94388.1 hypothetical protein [Okeania sp. SIO2F5]NEQ92222.1 hypothetical protein [Okeania sp. SIO2G4]